MSDFEIVHLRSGIKSLKQVSSQETFHPGIGPMEEARILHVEQQMIVERSARPGKFIIWDVGLGAAANAVAALEALMASDGEGDIEIHSFDITLDPLTFALENAEDLDYLIPHQQTIAALLEKQYVRVNDRIQWFLHLGDFRQVMHEPSLPSPHSMFYDPYSSVSNQEMWTLEHFTALRHRLDHGTPCLLTNYTGSSAVRVTWLLAGFYVGVGVGVGKKMETTVASNHIELLKEPLNSTWLFKRQNSQSSAPIRAHGHRAETISIADFAQLGAQPQFQ